MTRLFLRAPGLAAALIAAAVVAQPIVAQQRPIPTPESVFGFPIGKDSNLVDYEQSIDYFKKLAAAAPTRIHLLNVGTTSFGRPFTVAIITSPENYAKLDHYRALNMRIAHPEGLTDSAAHRIAREGKVIVDISGGLHASEIAGSQHTPQLAYELLAHAERPADEGDLRQRDLLPLADDQSRRPGHRREELPRDHVRPARHERALREVHGSRQQP